jgi:hypothetical protein
MDVEQTVGQPECWPLHPEVTVHLTGQDGNAFSILGRVQRALRQAGVSEGEITAFVDEACSGEYDHLLRTVMRWVEVR